MIENLDVARAPIFRAGARIHFGTRAFPDARRARLAAELESCRAHTLAPLDGVEPELFRARVHADFSPVGWHLGHIAFTEGFWLLAGGAPESAGALSPFTADSPRAARNGRHRVLRGGSWATTEPALRASFRTWYQPHVREVLAGLRCARG